MATRAPRKTEGSTTETESPVTSKKSPTPSSTNSTSAAAPSGKSTQRGLGRAVKAKVVAFLVQGMTLKDAAEKAGISKHTVSGWRQMDPEFQELLAEADERAVQAFIDEGVAQVTNQIKDLGPKAAEVIRESLDHTDPKVRLQAANMVLRHGGGPAATVNVRTFEGLIGGADPAAGD